MNIPVSAYSIRIKNANDHIYGYTKVRLQTFIRIEYLYNILIIYERRRDLRENRCFDNCLT